MICIPLVNRMSGILAIFHFLGYSLIKRWWGAYSSSPKKELEADFVGVAPIHFKPHPRGLLE